jgi:hypothetical protein
MIFYFYTVIYSNKWYSLIASSHILYAQTIHLVMGEIHLSLKILPKQSVHFLSSSFIVAIRNTKITKNFHL